VVTCASCGRENPEGFAFCGFCSAPLIEQPVAQALEERKVVSVLFCDLVGFTAASDHADPEDVRARIRPYHARLRSEIEGYGGTVEKFVGDAVMAAFGAPVAHEDDAERAVRAGLRIVSVRVGIESGLVVLGPVGGGSRVQKGATGDAVNTAARSKGMRRRTGCSSAPRRSEASATRSCGAQSCASP
jgi:class 3 adenylate cyclase